MRFGAIANSARGGPVGDRVKSKVLLNQVFSHTPALKSHIFSTRQQGSIMTIESSRRL